MCDAMTHGLVAARRWGARQGEDMTDILRDVASGHRTRPRWAPSSQGAVSALVLLFCGTLVLYPMVYLVILSVNTGDPLTFPPETYGTEHYEDLFDSWKVIANTALVACIATVMAFVIGFLAAWTSRGPICPAGHGWSG